MPESIRLNNISIPIPANPRDNPTSAQLNSDEILKILTQAWEHYKIYMIDTNGRPLAEPDTSDLDADHDTDERITFSESVSYVLLRAVWMNDEATFYKTWLWAKNNLQRININQVYSWNQRRWINNPKKDHLFAWRYTPSLAGRSGGIIHQTGGSDWHGGLEAASDADLDIAASLIFAFQRWNKEEYLEEAKKILKDIWDKFVIQQNGKYYLIAGDQFRNSKEINPSYLRPAYFKKLFPAVDPSHPWQELTITSYEVITQSADIPLRNENNQLVSGAANLPPNWVRLTPSGLSDSNIFQPQGGQIFGWDAFRTLFAVAQDYAWNGSPEARKYLTDNSCSPTDAGPYCFLKRELDTHGRILGGYNHDGTPVTSTLPQAQGLNQEQFAMYGAYLPYFYYAGDLQSTQKVLDLLQKFYHSQGYWGENPYDYYGQNWAWFGLALINNTPTAVFAPISTSILPTPATSPSCITPMIFLRNDDTPDNLIRQNQWEIEKTKVDIQNQETSIRKDIATHYKERIERANKKRTQLFNRYVDLWLQQREIGNPSLEPLQKALEVKNFASAYGSARLAYILVSGNPNPGELSILKELGYSINNSSSLSTLDRYHILFRIHQEYINKTSTNGAKETRDPLLEADILFQLSIQFSSLSENERKIIFQEKKYPSDFNPTTPTNLLQLFYDSTRAKLKQIFDSTEPFKVMIENTYLSDPQRESERENKEKELISNPLYKTIASRMLYRRVYTEEKDIRSDIIKQFKFFHGHARELLAQIILHQLNDTEPSQFESEISQAYSYITAAADNPIMKGFFFQQIKRITGEILAQWGFFLKDQEKTTQLLIDGQIKSYQDLLCLAKSLLNDVINWENQYNLKIPNENNRPIWLKQISTYAKLWLANIKMFETADDRQGKATEYLERQKSALAEVANSFIEILNRNVLGIPAKAHVQRLLAENLARQGFIEADLGKLESAQNLFTQAKNKLLQEVLPSANPQVQAEAHLWLAKIKLVEAGLKNNQKEEEQTLTEAQTEIESALKQVDGKYLLTLTTLSSALQTYGDILIAQKKFVEAETQYRKALEIWDKNRFAHASLGDILNWRGDYGSAGEEYQKVSADHPTYRYAQLGLREIEMRQDEIYSQESIDKIEVFASRIFNEEAPNSFLIIRAIEDLIEAYGTNEDLQEKIVELGQKYLSDQYSYFNPRFRAKLYLKVAEALSWRKRYNEALEILSPEKMPPELYHTINSKDSRNNYTNPELKAYYDLLLAEIKMKQGNRSSLLTSSLEQTVFQSKEPELVARLVLDRIESHSRERNYEKMAEETKKYLTPQNLARVRELFSVRDQNLNFLKFKFKLHRKLAEALQWGKKYELALAELDKIDAEINEAERSNSLPPNYIALLKAWVKVHRGENYLIANQSVRNFSLATQNFNEAINLLKDINPRSKEANITLAWAYFGLGEVYRYGNKNYENSKANYLKAKEIAEKLPEKSDERALLLTRIFLGLAKLEEMNGNPDLAAEYLSSSIDNKNKLESVFPELVAEISSSHLSIHYRVHPLLNTASQTWLGPDGRNETQLSLGSEIPLDFIPGLPWLHLTFNQQLDLAQDSQLYSPYLGGKIYFDTLCRTIFSNETQACTYAFPLTLSIEGKLGTIGEGSTIFFHQPDLKVNASLLWKYLNINSLLNFDFQDERLNTYYAGIQISPFADSSNEFLRALHFSADYNSFYFTYLGDFRQRHQIGFGINWEPEIIPHLLKIKAGIEALPYFTRQTMETETNPLQWWENNWGAKFNAGLEFKLGRHFRINLDYTREQNPEYPLNFLNVFLVIQF